MDPHGAVGFQALSEYLLRNKGSKGIFLETAHPVKFYDVVEPIIQTSVPIPDAIKSILHKDKKAVSMKAEYSELKDYLKAKR